MGRTALVVCAGWLLSTGLVEEAGSPEDEGTYMMLVLSRKKNESIVINDDITIVVVEIRGDKVRLGVEAPREVPVHRREVFDLIHSADLVAEENPAGKADAADTGGEA